MRLVPKILIVLLFVLLILTLYTEYIRSIHTRNSYSQSLLDMTHGTNKDGLVDCDEQKLFAFSTCVEKEMADCMEYTKDHNECELVSASFCLHAGSKYSICDD
ncbi:hypothetical protein CDIK_3592 [Cucumispora dikerogammari]|nr:hypothetical protein CDIK_3592 [Cucumispora dikerogammari]